jgi:hypothetical protein
MKLAFTNPGNYPIAPGSSVEYPVWVGSGGYAYAITHVEVLGDSVRYGHRWALNPCLGFNTAPRFCLIETLEHDPRKPALYEAIGRALSQL